MTYFKDGAILASVLGSLIIANTAASAVDVCFVRGYGGLTTIDAICKEECRSPAHHGWTGGYKCGPVTTTCKSGCVCTCL